jgi:hypothetical protein
MVNELLGMKDHEGECWFPLPICSLQGPSVSLPDDLVLLSLNFLTRKT